MVVSSQTRVVVMLSALLCSTLLQADWGCVSRKTDMRDARAVALLVGGAVAGACAVYKGIEWLFSKTTQQIIEQARSTYHAELFKHQKHLSYYYSQWHPIMQVDEHMLYAIASYQQSTIRARNMNSYTSSLQGSLNLLLNHREQLAKRLQKLDAVEVQHAQPIIYQLIADIDAYTVKLDRVVAMLVANKSYFNLYDLESLLLQRYNNELLFINNYLANSIESHLYVYFRGNAAIHNYYGIQYPYMNYFKNISDDINQLSQAIDYANVYYQSRLKNADQLRINLQIIKNVVVSSRNYAEEVHRYEIAKLERERLQLVREQIAIEERRNADLQKLARIQNEQLRVQGQQLHAQLIEQAILQRERACVQRCKEVAARCERECKPACQRTGSTQSCVNECKRACEQASRNIERGCEYYCDTACNNNW